MAPRSRSSQGSPALRGTSDVPSEVISWGRAGMALENLKDLFVLLARAANPPRYHSSATEHLSAPDQSSLALPITSLFCFH